jgi:glycosyltransferase involved in cell wall biosynthesis
VANPYANHPHRTEIRFPSVRVIGVPARVATGLRAERRLQRIEDMRPDVIHVHGLGPLGLLGTLLARRTGIPLVVTWHTDWDAYIEHYSLMTPVMAAAHRVWRLTSTGGDTDTEEAAAGRARYADRGRAASELLGGAAAMIGAATVVTTPSNKTARRVAELYGGRDVRPLPNGVDPLLPTPDRVVPRAPGVRFLYVGRISPEKSRIVRAFRIVNRLVPSTELMLAWATGAATRPPALVSRANEPASKPSTWSERSTGRCSGPTTPRPTCSASRPSPTPRGSCCTRPRTRACLSSAAIPSSTWW